MNVAIRVFARARRPDARRCPRVRSPERRWREDVIVMVGEERVGHDRVAGA